MLPFVLALDCLLAALFAADWALVGRPAGWVLERELPERAGLDREFERALRIAGPRRALAAELWEEFPPAVSTVARWIETGQAEPRPGDPSGGPDRVRLAPADAGRGSAVVRRYRASRRGSQRFGDVRLRVRGPLGLAWRQHRFRGEQWVAVDPALPGLARRLALATSERWRDLGVKSLRRPGGATEFESLREYVSGDDVRAVDWKAFAKRGQPIVRAYQEERGQELVLLVDCGRRMAATGDPGGSSRARGWTKLDHALDAALQLGAVALAAGDRVGVLAFAAGTRAWVAPRRGPRQTQRLREALYELTPELVESGLERALVELAVRHRRRATIVLFSDVADPLSVPDQGRALRAASQNHAVVFAALDDPDLRALGADPDAEPGLRAAANALELERARSLRELARSGVRVASALPAEAAGAAIAAWLEARRARAR